MMNTTTRHLTTLAVTAMLAASAHAQPCEPEYIGTTSAIASFDIVADTLIEARERIGLEIYDVSDPNNPIKRARVELPDALYMNMDADGNTVLVQTDLKTAQLIDISDPDNPVVGGEIEFLHEIQHLGLAGDYACLHADPPTGFPNAVLRVYDVSDIQNPTQIMQTLASPGNTFQMSEHAIMTFATNRDDIQIHDLTGPVQPAPAATFPARRASLNGNMLLIADLNELSFYNIDDPTNPTLLANPTLPIVPGYITLLDDVMIAYYEDTQLSIATTYDISNPANPQSLHNAVEDEHLGRSPSPEHRYGNSYAVNTPAGIEVLDDISMSFDATMLNPTPLWGIPFEHDGYVYGARNRSLTVAQPAPLKDLQPIATLQFDSPLPFPRENQILGVIQGTILVRSEGYHFNDASLYAIDISDPLSPTLTAQLPVDHELKYTVHGDYIYTVDGTNQELITIELDNAGAFTQPTTTNIPLEDDQPSYTIQGDRIYIAQAYVSTWTHDFNVISIEDPANPVLLGSADLAAPSLRGDFGVYDGHAYFSADNGFFTVVNFSDFPTVSSRTYTDIFQDTTFIGMQGERLFLSKDNEGILITDVSQGEAFPTSGPYMLDTTSRNDGSAQSDTGTLDFPYLYASGNFGGDDISAYDLSTCTGDCPADLTGDGVIDFFDVSAFLSAFNNQDPAADFTNDGTYDFFDVSAFLDAYAAGCP